MKKTTNSFSAVLSRVFSIIAKAQPTGSSVHVDTPMGSDEDEKDKPASRAKTPTPIGPDDAAADTSDGDFIDPSTPIDNTEATIIKAGLGLLVDKAVLTTEGRKHVASHNFALPPDRYPIHDLSHARNALSRSAGKPEEAKVKAAVYRKYPSLKKVEKDQASNDDAGMYDMQRIIEGMDYELEQGEAGGDTDMAKETALNHLAMDPDYYRKKEYAENETDDVLDMARAGLGISKDTSQTDYNPDDGEGFNLDLGSGQARKFGHVGIDLFPYDHGTIVHDLNQGIPFPDGSAKKVHMANSLHEMGGLSKDPKPLLAEIQRVLMPGGQFHYEGPNQIYNYPEYLEQENLQKLEVQKGNPTPGGWAIQDFRRVTPDPATANDAEPRIGVAQYDMLPADALLAMDAVGYYNADATSSGRGNRVAGYPSQGALVDKGGPGSGPGAGSASHDQKRNEKTLARIKRQASGDKHRYEAGKPSIVGKSAKMIPIFKADKMKQIVYGVVLSPDEADLQDDFMTADDIEAAAHAYMIDYRVVGAAHEKPMAADVVESYIAPRDFDFMGQHGPQKVKKGAWVIGVKVADPKEWQKVLNGEYNGFSVGGLGLRDAV